MHHEDSEARCGESWLRQSTVAKSCRVRALIRTNTHSVHHHQTRKPAYHSYTMGTCYLNIQISIYDFLNFNGYFSNSVTDERVVLLHSLASTMVMVNVICDYSIIPFTVHFIKDIQYCLIVLHTRCA